MANEFSYKGPKGGDKLGVGLEPTLVIDSFDTVTGEFKWTVTNNDDDISATIYTYIEGFGIQSFSVVGKGGSKQFSESLLLGTDYVIKAYIMSDIDAEKTSPTVEDYYTTPIPIPGQVVFTSSGSFLVPLGVTSVSVVAVGGGAGGDHWNTYAHSGSGGGLGWKNNIAVTPGQSYSVVVGAGGAAFTPGYNGGNSYFINTSTVCGYGGLHQNAPGGVFVGDGGGNGGHGSTAGGNPSACGGGGGAGGYSGNGGDGGMGTVGDPSSTAGQGGAGGGGQGGIGDDGQASWGGGGGGVGILGEGSSGAAGGISGWGAQKNRGGGGSGGTGSGLTPTGGLYGAGGGGTNLLKSGGNGGNGIVRIMWGPGRSYPSTNVGDQ